MISKLTNIVVKASEFKDELKKKKDDETVIYTVHWDLDHKPSLNEAQDIVGGYVQMVHSPKLYDKGEEIKQILVNEEGLIYGFKGNTIASAMANMPLVGNALILEGEHMWD